MTKPPYHVPSMAEIEAVHPNGYTVASTFSGCGGSCLGFKMEGFKVLWASEFIPAAQQTYRANHPQTYLDVRDIRQVTAADIRKVVGADEIDVLEGSPPCASFSTAGKREAGWGCVKPYSDTAQRVDDLFFEFVRILGELRPKMFVAENVSGLVKGTAKGYFLEILAAMKSAGYRVKCQVLDAQWLGVPQMRQRTIFIGVREDLGRDPVHPKPLPYRYSVRDAVPWIDTIEVGDGFGAKRDVSASASAYMTVGTGPSSGNGRATKVTALPKVEAVVMEGAHGGSGEVRSGIERRKFTIAELRRICAFPDDFVLTGSYAQQWERLGRAVPPVMMAAVAREVKGVLDDCRN